MDAGELAARARTLEQLSGVVQAMRTIASARRRRAQERFAGLEAYAVATRTALGEAVGLLEDQTLSFLVDPSAQARVVTLFSEHGFVGPLNDRLLAHGDVVARARGARHIGVGGRGLRLCREMGVPIVDGGSMPSTVGGVSATAERLLDALFRALAARRASEIRFVFAEHHPPVRWSPRTVVLFPPVVEGATPSSARLPPYHMLDVRTLATRAIEEYAFAQTNWMVAQAFASEQAARFVAMDAAHHHVDDKLDELHALERELRQETITNELLEIASGAHTSEREP